MKTSEEESDYCRSPQKSTKKVENVEKVLSSKKNDNKSDNKMNGINGCSETSAQHLKTEEETGGQKSGESSTGIRLLCDAVDVIETKSYRKCQHLNGLSVDNDCINGQTNSCSLSVNDSVPPISCCCCQTSPSSSSSATTSCSTSSATLSCDTNTKESMVHMFEDKDINILTNRVSTQLSISELNDKIDFVNYESERQMPDIMRLIQKDLSEPYSIYTYRYFIHNWPHLCYLAMDGTKCVGAIVCKLDLHKMLRRGYIAMLAVDENYRKRKMGSNLVLKAIEAMIAGDADEVVLETEVTNKPALQLYENLGFVRDKRLFRYYLNGVDALRLKLWLK